MSEIEIGEYVRLHYGKIDRVKSNDYYMQQYIECEKGLYPRENIEEHSQNIIDLIEIGDYVNGSKVEKYKLSTNLITKERYILINDNWYLYDWNIKTLLTKEQYELVQYKVGD